MVYSPCPLYVAAFTGLDSVALRKLLEKLLGARPTATYLSSANGGTRIHAAIRASRSC
jgi:hypothetical protein